MSEIKTIIKDSFNSTSNHIENINESFKNMKIDEINQFIKNIISKWTFGAKDIETIGVLLKFAIEKGAKFELSGFDLSFAKLSKLMELTKEIFNNMSVDEVNDFLKNIVSIWIFEAKEKEIQAELIEFVIEKGAKFEQSEFDWSFAKLSKHIELIKESFNNMSVDEVNEFLKNIASIWTSDAKEKEIQAELIEFAIEKGAKFELSDLNYNGNYEKVDILKIDFEIIKKHVESKNQSERATQLLEVISIYVTKNLPLGLEQNDKVFALIKLALNSVSSIENHIHFPLALVANYFDMLINDISFDIQKIFQIFCYTLEKKYNPENVELQTNLLLKILDNGLDINSVSIEQIQGFDFALLKIMIEHGLDQRVLSIFDVFPFVKISEAIEFIEQNKIQILPLILLDDEFFDMDLHLQKRIIDNIPFRLDISLNIEKIIQDFIEQVKIFADFVNDIIGKKVNFAEALKSEFCLNGSLLHVLSKNNHFKILKLLLENDHYDINVVNELGQTALFYAASPSVADTLVEYGINASHRDVNGKTWIYTKHNSEMLDYAIKNNYISQEEFGYFTKIFLNEGNFDHAAKIAKIHYKADFNLKDNLVEIIIEGLKHSIENNKYQAILHLINNAGIKIPQKYSYLLNSISDAHPSDDYNFITGLVHKLAHHYINLIRIDFIKSLSIEGHQSNEIISALNHFFSTGEFTKLKTLCDLNGGSKFLSKIEDEFSAYTVILSKVSSLLDHDYTFNTMILNGLKPSLVAIDASQSLYRGIKRTLSNDDIDYYFKYGHQAFANSVDTHKILGFNVNQAWNIINNSRWEYGGTYLSLDPHYAATFAEGLTSSNKMADSILIESSFNKHMPMICGSNGFEFEIITSNIPGDNIVAIYKLNITKINGTSHYYAETLITNPYSDNKATPSYQVGDEIIQDKNGEELFNNLCMHLPIKDVKSCLYDNYTDFFDSYNGKNFSEAKEELFNEQFADRELYHEDYFCLNGEVDLSEKCDIC